MVGEKITSRYPCAGVELVEINDCCTIYEAETYRHVCDLITKMGGLIPDVQSQIKFPILVRQRDLAYREYWFDCDPIPSSFFNQTYKSKQDPQTTLAGTDK